MRLVEALRLHARRHRQSDRLQHGREHAERRHRPSTFSPPRALFGSFTTSGT
jgi:hypothetical protein